MGVEDRGASRLRYMESRLDVNLSRQNSTRPMPRWAEVAEVGRG
jgi:hypothetical protein